MKHKVDAESSSRGVLSNQSTYNEKFVELWFISEHHITHSKIVTYSRNKESIDVSTNITCDIFGIENYVMKIWR